MKRKKAAASITAIVMCMSMAYSPKNYNNYSIVYAEGTETEYTPVDFDSETGTITRCWSMDDVINIPPVIDGTVVISIDSRAFGGRAMKEIYLPETITSIGSHAFSGCKNLERIDVPYCTENIGSMAFKDCISLKTVNLPDNLISISDNMFTGCSSLEEIIIPDKVKIIEFDAFKGCTALKNVMFPDGLECIRNSAFEGCESIEELVIPVNVFDFGYNAFEGTRWFENKRNEGTDIVINGVLLETKNDEKTIVIPDGITGIGGGALANKGRTSSICLPDSVTYICDKAFYSCGRLKTVELSDNITYIGASAFEGCHNLEETKLPEKLTTIGNRAFFNCDTITNMTIPASVTEIGDYSIGYVSNGTRINGFTIKGYSGSAAERYAKFTFDFIEIEGETTKGDVNCDGNVNMADAVLIMQSLANPDKYGVNGTDETHITAQGEKNGDMDGNGLTNADALEIQKMLLKLS